MGLGAILFWSAFILLMVLVLRAGAKKMPVTFSHWHHLVENLKISTLDFERKQFLDKALDEESITEDDYKAKLLKVIDEASYFIALIKEWRTVRVASSMY